jgi:hypothetical protein
MICKNFIECLNIDNSTTMPPRRVKKAPKATLNAPRDNEPTPGELEPTIEPTIEPANEPTIDGNKLPQQEKAAALKWTTEMIEALVECIYEVWKDGRAADNGFKKEA